MQPHPQRLRGFALILHFIAPTAVGVICYILLAFLIVGAHTLAVSANGAAYPAILSEELLQGYTNFVIQPLATITNNETLNNGLVLVMWAIIGWIVFSVLGAIAGAINEWRNTQEDVSIPQRGVVVRHPLQRSLLVHMLWRLGISLVIVLFTLLILPVAGLALESDLRTLEALSTTSALPHIGTALGIWVVLFHCYVIFLRAYLLRTRVFGEILY